ncbi:uncharacterized protein ACOB8E_015300 [Sarcophilus harrisii]
MQGPPERVRPGSWAAAWLRCGEMERAVNLESRQPGSHEIITSDASESKNHCLYVYTTLCDLGTYYHQENESKDSSMNLGAWINQFACYNHGHLRLQAERPCQENILC